MLLISILVVKNKICHHPNVPELASLQHRKHKNSRLQIQVIINVCVEITVNRVILISTKPGNGQVTNNDFTSASPQKEKTLLDQKSIITKHSKQTMNKMHAFTLCHYHIYKDKRLLRKNNKSDQHLAQQNLSRFRNFCCQSILFKIYSFSHS